MSWDVATLTTFGIGLTGVVYMGIYAVPGDTLSEMTNELPGCYLGAILALMWTLDFVMGHVFWPQYRGRKQ